MPDSDGMQMVSNVMGVETGRSYCWTVDVDECDEGDEEAFSDDCGELLLLSSIK